MGKGSGGYMKYMKEHSGWLTKILPTHSDNIISGADLDIGYKKFSRGLFGILTVLVLVPLTIITLLSHHQYKQLLQQKELDQLFLNLAQTQSTIEKFVMELQSVIKFVARDDRYQELLDPNELRDLFVRLQSEYPGFVDIEVIDSEGMQKAYFGPYQLEGHKYTDQTWYKEVMLRGVYISNVFSGFRNVPHFVIAVSRKHLQQKSSWVLRVTIDGQTLQNYVDTVSTTYVDDIFLVDKNFIAQTRPQKYGKIGEKSVLYDITDREKTNFKKRVVERHITLQKTSDMMIVKKSFQGRQILQGMSDLKNVPWKLVMVKEQYLYADAWFAFKMRLTTIFLSCTIIGLFVIVEIGIAITNHLRASDMKLEQFLVEAEQPNKLASIGRLAAGVAHEINNPLAIINQKAGFIQDLLDMSGDFTHKGPMGDALDGIQNSVERCKKITHRLLGFARQADVVNEEVDINVIVREVVDFLAKEASYNQIKINFVLDPDIRKIFSDRGQLLQIFLNITNNAIDAIGRDGQITLSSMQIDEKNIQVSIADDGPGMSAEVQQHIFDPFFTTKETGKGTGLGLSITYGLVKKFGGKIKIISEVGKGTTFEITLPIAKS
jgi:two-component system, NtrC family, sensor kinase